MDAELATVVYCSTSEMKGTDAEIAAELHDILSKARLKNTELGITGALLYHAGKFGQILEGPPQAVAGLLRTIRSDVRNRDLTIALDASVCRRIFPDWTMAFSGIADNPEVAAAIDAVFAGSEFAGEEMLLVLKSLIVQEEEWCL